jgi:hypothetical protein
MARYTIQFTENHEEKVTPTIMHLKGEVMENVRDGTMRHFCEKGVAVVVTSVPEAEPEKKPDPEAISSASPPAPVSQETTATPRRGRKPRSL